MTAPCITATEQTIRDKVAEAFAPLRLEIENESHKHHGHAGSPGTGDSHFALTVVSDSFAGMDRVMRQRRVYELLADELAGPVHALALALATPEEAEKRGL